MDFGERIEVLRDRVHDAAGRILARWLPDLAPPKDCGEHREAVSTLEKGRKAYNAKNYPRAEQLFKQAGLLDESYAKAHYYLGLALYKQNDSQGAVRAWKRATELDPNGSMGLKAQRKLRYAKKGMDRVVNELQERVTQRRR